MAQNSADWKSGEISTEVVRFYVGRQSADFTEEGKLRFNNVSRGIIAIIWQTFKRAVGKKVSMLKLWVLEFI